ncbi:MAG: MFS transporter [Fuerstiella sp.]
MQQIDNNAAGISLNLRGRLLVLTAGFLGWMFAGWEMSLLPLSARAVTIGMLQDDPAHQDWVAVARATLESPDGQTPDASSAEAAGQAAERLNGIVGEWFARYIAAFLFGAALGGWVFGWLGDHSGRVKAMALSIVWYAGFTGISYFVTTPLQMCVLRFIACMGIGGMWPAGVALVSEAWPDVSRPTLAGLIGTSANVGIALLSIVVKQIGASWPDYELTPDSWRWLMLLGAVPAVLGVWVLAVVPESPRWLAGQQSTAKKTAPLTEVLRPPLLKYTLSGIALGTIPLLGAWGSQKWILPWAGQVGARIGLESLKADTQTTWAIGAALGSLCGGWLATLLGRRTTYFAVSLGSLILAQLIFQRLQPADSWEFLLPVFLLGLVATVYFGWLPLFLPEMFPTRVRATGSGVSFNSGRIISAVVVLTISGFVAALDNDYARIGSITSWIYVAGMLLILIVPRSSESLAELDAADLRAASRGGSVPNTTDGDSTDADTTEKNMVAVARDVSED